MIDAERALFHWLNWVLGESRLVEELAYFVEELGPWIATGITLRAVLRPRTEPPHGWSTVVLVLLGVILSLSVSQVVSEEVYRARPFVVLDQSHLLIPQDSDSSFPCPPAVWSAAITVILASLPGTSAWRWSLVLTVLIGVTRPILGDHWPSDMVGSFILGGAIGYSVLLLRRPLEAVGSVVVRTMGRVVRK